MVGDEEAARVSANGSAKMWNAQDYDGRMGFVSQYGTGLIELLEPKAGERILDLGCGTGDLTAAIAATGAHSIGVDVSPDMIEQARRKYPELVFEVGDARTLRIAEPVDAVFSNAALHWVRPPEQAAASIALALRPGGRLVAEFGGAGNVGQIAGAIADVLHVYGMDAGERNPWYYPSIGEYAALLEHHGLEVVYSVLFDRPTLLAGGEAGIRHWLDMFADFFFAGMTAQDRKDAYAAIEERLRPALWHDGSWQADYRRIRVVAVKGER